MAEVKHKRILGNPSAQATAVRRLRLSRLIIPLDSTVEAESALQYGLMLSKWWDSELVLLHVIRTLRETRQAPGERVLYPDVHHDRGVQLASAYLEEISKKFRLHGVRVRWGVATGDTADMVISRTLASQAGMMLMKSRTRPAFDLSWDKPFERIWRATPVPLFTINKVPDSGELSELKKPDTFIVVVNSKECIATMMPYFRVVIGMSASPKVHIVYPIKRMRWFRVTSAVPPILDTELDQLEEDLGSLGADVSVTFTPSIMETVAKLNSVYEGSWVIIASNFHAPMRRAMWGSLAYTLIKQQVSPILAIPRKGVTSKRVEKANI